MAKQKSNLDRKLDSFARVTFLGEDGRPKSAVWLYAFLLAIGFGLLYVLLYLVFGFLFGKNGDAGLFTVILHALITAVVGSIPPVLLCAFLKEDRKALVAYAYVWLAVLFVLSLIMGVLLCDWKGGNGWIEFTALLTVVFFPSLAAILFGGIPAWILWRAERKRMKAAEEAPQKERPSYYNT